MIERGLPKAAAQQRLLQLQAMVDAIVARQQARKAASDLAQRLMALGVEPEKARHAAEKAQRNGCGLCMAKNRRGLPCIALGDGAGGRCRFHGGLSTGPKTPEGRQRALDALARAAAAKRRKDA